MDEVDTFGITLPVPTWQKLLALAGKNDRAPSDYLRQLINREAMHLASGESRPDQTTSEGGFMPCAG